MKWLSVEQELSQYDSRYFLRPSEIKQTHDKILLGTFRNQNQIPYEDSPNNVTFGTLTEYYVLEKSEESQRLNIRYVDLLLLSGHWTVEHSIEDC